MIPKDILKEVIVLQRASLLRLESGVLREKEIQIYDSFALLLTGIRRCGKSTFLHQLLKKQKHWYYLNLEDPRLDGFALSDFMRVESIMKEEYGEGGIYFFDEIQAVEKWEKFIRYLIDKKEKIVITGSNASLLSRELGTKLTGRHVSYELFPFSFREFLLMKKEKASLQEFDIYFQKGGFPEFLKKDDPGLLHELLSDVVMKDIAVRFGIKNTSFLTKITIYLVSHVGKEFSYNSLKQMFEIKSVQSVIDYVNYLENTYLIFLVQKFDYSYKKQQVAAKKVYSIDNGFSYVNSSSFSKDKGRMLENMVFLALRKKSKDIFYFQEKGECDFLVKDREKIVQALQVCFDFNEENQERELRGLLCALQEFHLSEGLILTYSQEDNFILEGKKIVLKPVWKWLLE
ncbi:MAG: ATP-binding protein [bacterium]|nr:ATP-binding protein [bacterium]